MKTPSKLVPASVKATPENDKPAEKKGLYSSHFICLLMLACPHSFTIIEYNVKLRADRVWLKG